MTCTVKTRPSTGNSLFVPHFGNMLNEMMNTSIEQLTTEPSKKATTPPTNIVTRDDQFFLYLALPGYTKDDIDLKIEGNRLSVTGKLAQDEDQKFRMREFNYTQIDRQFRLPKFIDRDSVKASFDQGVLEIKFSKLPEAKAKTITIS